MMLLGCVMQSVASGEFDPGPVPYTFVEIDHEIISTVIITLILFADSRRVVVGYNRKYVYKELVNRLVKLAQEKNCG